MPGFAPSDWPSWFRLAHQRVREAWLGGASRTSPHTSDQTCPWLRSYRAYRIVWRASEAFLDTFDILRLGHLSCAAFYFRFRCRSFKTLTYLSKHSDLPKEEPCSFRGLSTFFFIRPPCRVSSFVRIRGFLLVLCRRLLRRLLSVLGKKERIGEFSWGFCFS